MIKNFTFLIVIIIFTFNSCAQEKLKNVDEEELRLENDFHLDSDLSKEELLIQKIQKNDDSQITKFSNVIIFEDTLKALFQEISVDSINLDYTIFRYAMIGYYSLRQDGKLNNTKEIISIIDYTLPSDKKRFYTIDLKNKQYIFNTLVSHGRNSGSNNATKFSNELQSFQTSLGFYITGKTYIGSKGYSLRLHGDEVGYNDNVYKRAIVMHDAPYVSEEWVKRYGRIGRSLGCPVLPKNISKNVITTIKDKTVIFVYSNDSKYLKASKYLNLRKLLERMNLSIIED